MDLIIVFKRAMDFRQPAFMAGNLILFFVPNSGRGLESKKTFGGFEMERLVYIDTDECIGCENCVEICPEVFGFNPEVEKAAVILPEGGSEECIEDAMDSCPVECIHWEP
jgi:ferredoxin